MPKRIAKTKETLLRSRLFLITPCTTYTAIELKLFDGTKQDRNLHLVATDLTRSRHRRPICYRFINSTNNQSGTQFLCPMIAKLNQLWKLMTRLNIKKRHRNFGWSKSLLSESQNADGIFAARKKNRWSLKLSSDLTQYVNRFGF